MRVSDLHQGLVLPYECANLIQLNHLDGHLRLCAVSWGGGGRKKEGGGARKRRGEKGVRNGRRKGNEGGEKEKRKKGRGLEEDGVMEVQLHFSAIQRAMAQWHTYIRTYVLSGSTL